MGAKPPRIREAVFRDAVRRIRRAGGFNPDMLRDEPVRALVDQTADCLLEAVDMGLRDNDIPPEMAEKLERDVFVFSGCKTYHELREASQLLRDHEGRIKPFHKFYEEVKALHPTYNEQYLGAEYEFAVHAAQSAAQWADIERDGDAYDLQYRTANDGRVRPEHVRLEGITLPPSDPFWSEYMPPNGWRCRCRAVQVRKGKSERSDSRTAQQLGREATTQNDAQGRNRAEMFRFNPGRERVIFPRHHPYYNLSQQARRAVEQLADEGRRGGFAATTVGEAEALFRERLGVNCRLDGFRKRDLHQIRDLFESVQAHFEAFPELRREVHFVGSIEGRIMAFADEFFREMRDNPRNSWAKDEDIRKLAVKRARNVAYANCYAYSHSAGKEYGLDGVAFNAAWSGEKLTESLRSDVQARFHPPGCDTVKAVFDHEMAHRLDELLDIAGQLGEHDWYEEAVAKGPDHIAENLSRYALTNRYEFVAEAWSEFRNNPRPRQLAQSVGMLIEQAYEHKKSGE